MIPIGDDRIQNARTPIFTWLFIVVNVAVFLREISLDGPQLQAFIMNYAAIPSLIADGNNLHAIFTSMWLHGGWLHIIGNMLFLWIFGDNIEDALGHFGFVVFYIAGGVISSIAHIIMNWGSNVPSLGASGAIAACMGAYIVMFPRSRVKMLLPIFLFWTTFRVSAWAFLGMWIVIQAINGYTTRMATGTEGVAWWAHIGGFTYGVLIGILFRGKARRLVIIRND